MNGLDMIFKERTEQKTKHGYTIKDDAKYKNDELLILARYLLMADNDAEKESYEEWLFQIKRGPMFTKELKDKLNRKAPVTKWAIAGALIAARIDALYYTLQYGPDMELPK